VKVYPELYKTVAVLLFPVYTLAYQPGVTLLPLPKLKLHGIELFWSTLDAHWILGFVGCTVGVVT